MRTRIPMLGLACVVSWGCPTTEDRSRPGRVGTTGSPQVTGRNLMVASGNGLALITQGDLPQRDLVDARVVLEGREWPEVDACMKRVCVDAWVDRTRRVGAVRLRSGVAPAPAPEHVTLVWAHAARAPSAMAALRDAVRDAPPETRFSLIHAVRPPLVVARTGEDAGSKASLVAALDAGFTPTFVDAHGALDEALTEAARSGARTTRIVAVMGPSAWPIAPKPWHTEELIRAGRADGVEVGAFSMDTRSSASDVRAIARAGGGPRGHLTGAGDAWARDAVGGARVDVGEQVIELEGAGIGPIWGGEVRREGEAAAVALGRISGGPDGMQDAVVVFRLEGAGTIRVRVGEEEVVAAEVELDDAGDAVVVLEAVDAALADFEAGAPKRARDRVSDAREQVARTGRDATLLSALEGTLDDFVGD